jgi:hypothetical protein
VVFFLAPLAPYYFNTEFFLAPLAPVFFTTTGQKKKTLCLCISVSKSDKILRRLPVKKSHVRNFSGRPSREKISLTFSQAALPGEEKKGRRCIGARGASKEFCF